MKTQKIIASLLLFILLTIQLNSIALPNYLSTITNDESKVVLEDEHYKYFYSQLSNTAKKIYDAIVEMYTSEQLKTGNTNYDLVENGKISTKLVDAYKKGNNELIVAFENARDAFYLDYPEVFYINIEKYSIRITSDKNGYHVWLGTGNNDSYYLKGFSSVESVNNAEIEYQTALNSIVDNAKTLSNNYSGEELIVKQIEYVHNEVIKSATYKLDDKCQERNRGHIRTPYGALVAKEAVCEGYSKAVKVALDKLGIPCVLVRGVYKWGNVDPERHMWNYVQIGEKWYAVDATFDDADKTNQVGDIDIAKEYFLAGESKMSFGHYADGIMSAQEFEFVYPDLEYDTYGIKEVANIDGLEIKYQALPYDGNTYVALDISYKGMNFSDAKKAGYHFLTRYYSELNNPQEKWYYIDTKLYPSMIKDGANSFILSIFSIPYMEIAVVDIPIDERAYSEDLKESVYYQSFLGDESMFLASSGILEIPDATYVQPPRFTSASPYVDSKLKAGKTTHIKVTYNQDLEKTSDEVTPSCYITTKNAWTTSATINSSITNFEWDGKRTVQFDFKPSSQYGDNSVIYYFNISGLVGKDTKKVPTPAHYYVQQTFGCTYSMAQAKAWQVFARPTLIDDGTTSVEGWNLSDGTTISKEQASQLNGITDKLALVVDKTTKEQADKMNSLLEEKTNSKVLSSETYNINLILCNKKVLSTANGHKVTVYLGFPEGYGPDDAGVTFKVYHFKTKSVDITEVEEIPCVITPYGLLVTCNAFSPFEVVAMENSAEEVTDNTKSVVINTDLNGSILELDNNIVNLKPGEAKTYSIKANDGYQIESLNIFGKEIVAAQKQDTYNITINYSDILEGNNIINVSFVAKTVAQTEEERGENVVAQLDGVLSNSDFDIVLEANKETVAPGEIFAVNASLKNFENIEDGIIAVAGKFEFDTDLVEIYKQQDVALIGKDGWNLSAFNDKNFKFVSDNEKYIVNDSELFTVYFKAKENITTEALVKISLKDVEASGGNGIIISTSEPEETVSIVIEEEKIMSNKYSIDEEEKNISGILPKTTVKDFKNNVDTKQTIEFTSTDNKVLKDTDIITTGTKIKVGKNLNYTLVVIGDIDRDGDITINDLARIKLHLIDKEKITGINLIAANVDNMEAITINDLARMKLIIIGIVKLK